jgi:Tfp pilus assembly protein PilZ
VVLASPVPLTVSLDAESIEEFESAFASRVGDGVIFLPSVDEPLVGTRIRATLALKSGEEALVAEGHVSWRYPEGSLPPGREAGVGLLVESISDEHRARLDRMRRAPDAGTAAAAPGTRLGPLQLRPPAPPPLPDGFDDAGPTSAELPDLHSDDFFPAEREAEEMEKRPPFSLGDDDDEPPAPPPLEETSEPTLEMRPPRGEATAEESLAPTEEEPPAPPDEHAHVDAAEAAAAPRMPDPSDVDAEDAEALSAAGHVPRPRALPAPPGYQQEALPMPPLHGAAFRFDYKKNDADPPMVELETFAWGLVGTQRPSDKDMRTWPPGYEPGQDEPEEAGFIGWDEPSDSMGGEVSDPSHRVTQVVEDAMDLPDVDDDDTVKDLPVSVGESDDDDTETDVAGLVTESSESPGSLSLPHTIWFGPPTGGVEVIFDAGLSVPAQHARAVEPVGGDRFIELALFEESVRATGGRTLLDMVHIPLHDGEQRVEVRFDVSDDGHLEVRRADEEPLLDRLALSWKREKLLPPEPKGFFGRVRKMLGW